jgi:hypothetical protein
MFRPESSGRHMRQRDIDHDKRLRLSSKAEKRVTAKQEHKWGSIGHPSCSSVPLLKPTSCCRKRKASEHLKSKHQHVQICSYTG